MDVRFFLTSFGMTLVRRVPGSVSSATCALVLALFATGCTQHTQPEAFATPDAAVDSVITALRADDNKQLSRILGSDAKELLASGDPIDDASSRQEFLEQFEEQHRLVPDESGNSVTLEVGKSQWPMPIPIMQNIDGWRFDTAAGMDELLNRRIGRNELDTIETCLALNDAQVEYFQLNPNNSPVPEFSRKIVSSKGSRDGLAWPTADGEPMSPLGELAAEAADEGYAATGKGGPYHGYRFRILTAQGDFASGGRMSYLTGDRLTQGFAIVAYPAQYGNSGIMTFIMNQQGIVFERDLGEDTEKIAKSMAEFDPDPTWDLAE